MLTPVMIERPTQPYVGIRAQVTMRTIDEILVPLGQQVVLPAGRYATVRYAGHPDGIINAVADLRGWAEKEGLAWDMTRAPDGEHWAARLQIHETDSAVEPDMTRWITQLAFRLAD
jgi:hypothetical protein